MKKRSRIPVLVVLMLVFAATLLAQSPLITNPSYLSQFPSVEKVRMATKGNDDVDSYARFMAALWRINDMIKEDLVKAPNGGYYDMPPAAQTVQYRYSGAITRYSIDEVPPAGRDPRFRPLETKYEKDAAFFDGLLTQFFSPKFRIDYYAWIRKPVPAQTAATAALGNKGAAVGTSTAKASESHMTVVGLKFGEAVVLPKCPTFSMMAENCVYGGSEMVESVLKGIGIDLDTSTPNVVTLGTDNCPSWVTGCSAYISIHDGRLDGITLLTNGRNSVNAVTRDLTAKFGKPTRTKAGIITPDTGNPFNVNEPEWDLPGLRVRYEVVRRDEGDEGRIHTDQGVVRIMTDAEFLRQVKATKEREKNKL